MADVKVEEGNDSLEAAARRHVQNGATKQNAPSRPPAARMPAWLRFATPVLLVMALLLLTIGAWAVGAMIYMQRVTPIAPEDVQYPLLRWSDEVGTSGGYSPESRLMAMAMLGCIPLALVMGMLALLLRRQARRTRAPAPQ
ncbi:MAG TPA: hypothetical protein VM008_21460 [Phycisphaerae bacterium]|nr:hypothetical protein [Phycisphaerae bacterium]